MYEIFLKCFLDISMKPKKFLIFKKLFSAKGTGFLIKKKECRSVGGSSEVYAFYSIRISKLNITEIARISKGGDLLNPLGGSGAKRGYLGAGGLESSIIF